jgi:hypothetical protein
MREIFFDFFDPWSGTIVGCLRKADFAELLENLPACTVMTFDAPGMLQRHGVRQRLLTSKWKAELGKRMSKLGISKDNRGLRLLRITSTAIKTSTSDTSAALKKNSN